MVIAGKQDTTEAPRMRKNVGIRAGGQIPLRPIGGVGRGTFGGETRAQDLGRCLKWALGTVGTRRALTNSNGQGMGTKAWSDHIEVGGKGHT